MTLKVDTFQKDIVDEIKRRDKDLADVKSAPNITDNKPIPQKESKMLTVLVVASALAIMGILGLLYYYFHDSLLPPSANPVEVTPKDTKKITEDLSKISPVLNGEIGLFVTSVEKRDQGYILTLNNYSPVFSYMIRNESSYIQDLVELFPKGAPSSLATTTEVVVSTSSTKTLPAAGTVSVPASSTTSSKTVVSSSTVASSTKKGAVVPKVAPKKSPTKNSSTTEAILPSTTPPIQLDVATPTPITPLFVVSTSTEATLFKDITIENQNMRVYTHNNSRIVYAFVSDTKLLISNSPEGILALKSAILR